MRGVSKQHQPLNMRELMPNGTAAPPQDMSFLSTALKSNLQETARVKQYSFRYKKA